MIGLGKKEETFGDIKQHGDSNITQVAILPTWGNLPVGLSLGDVSSAVPETRVTDHIQNTLVLVLYVVPWVVEEAKHFLGKAFY